MIPKLMSKKKNLCDFETTKINWKSPDVSNPFKMRFDELLNSKGNKWDRIKLIKTFRNNTNGLVYLL